MRYRSETKSTINIHRPANIWNTVTSSIAFCNTSPVKIYDSEHQNKTMTTRSKPSRCSTTLKNLWNDGPQNPYSLTPKSIQSCLWHFIFDLLAISRDMMNSTIFQAFLNGKILKLWHFDGCPIFDLFWENIIHKSGVQIVRFNLPSYEFRISISL